ncbi:MULTISPECIES: hypothetical protein [Streptomyces]|uniref:Secreted protein n=2 Tax=Streptomyces TaxID=1883 RepID=A0A1E7LWG1_9ACTN|nr:hypothetical protein [Streptomyces nanshensis]OEV20496.1 hypothetical protein AN221_09475 [Streptomyces nanshensis]
MSRTQWCCLTALLAVVMGLLCGPVGASSAAGSPSPVAVSARETPEATAGASTAVRVATTFAPAPAPVVEAADADTRVPGCGKLRDHEGEPAVPTRARAAYDQAPGLAPWALPPATTGALSAGEPSGIRARAPAPATPTPVELSVLRV